MEEEGNVFGDIFGDNRSTPVDALLRLLDSDNISMKTDYNMTQIKVKNHIRSIARLHNEEVRSMIENFLQEFSEDMVSLKRKSREEVVNALKEISKTSMIEEGNVLGSMIPK